MKENKPLKRICLDNFHIAGFSHWDGCEAFEHLKIGKELQLVREEDNPFDPFAIAIWYENYKLGFVPRTANHDLALHLDMGLSDIYEIRITRLSPDEHPEHQVEVILYIKNRYLS